MAVILLWLSTLQAMGSEWCVEQAASCQHPTAGSRSRLQLAPCLGRREGITRDTQHHHPDAPMGLFCAAASYLENQHTTCLSTCNASACAPLVTQCSACTSVRPPNALCLSACPFQFISQQLCCERPSSAATLQHEGCGCGQKRALQCAGCRLWCAGHRPREQEEYLGEEGGTLQPLNHTVS